MISLLIVGTSARERVVGRSSGTPLGRAKFLKWTPPSAELKQTKGVPADN